MESNFIKTSLSRAAVRYAPAAAMPEEKDKLFPDSVVAPFIAAAKAAPPRSALVQSPSPVFTLEECKNLILSALDEFSPALGQKAGDIFNDGFDQAVAASRKEGFTVDWNNVQDSGSRWRLEQVPAGKCRMMRSRAAGSTVTALDPGNPGSKAVIDYQFDGTLATVAYLAHELGHSIADDNLQKGGEYKFSDNKGHMQETQAYFIQNIFYGYVQKHASEIEKSHHGFSSALQRHLDETMEQNLSLLREENTERLHERPMGILAARGVYNIAEKAPSAEREKITAAILQENGPADIIDVLTVAGVKNSKQLVDFAQNATASAQKYVSAQNLTQNPAQKLAAALKGKAPHLP